MFRFRKCGFLRGLRLRLPVTFTFVWEIEQEADEATERDGEGALGLGRQVQGGAVSWWAAQGEQARLGEAEKMLGGEIGRKDQTGTELDASQRQRERGKEPKSSNMGKCRPEVSELRIGMLAPPGNCKIEGAAHVG